jgi:hypothetical protein
MSIVKKMFYMYSIDLVVCMVVIAMVVVLLGYQAQKTRTVIMGVAATSEIMGSLRVPMSTYYAIHGEWPPDREALKPYLPGRWPGSVATTSDEALIANGAITARVRRVTGANMLTIHPAVRAGDPLGPVTWVAGRQSMTKGWDVIGEDRTTFSENKILQALK